MQSKSLLYARRVKGDLDLGLEPARIKRTGLATIERDWAREITPGGLLPGGVWQDVYTATVAQNYREGTRMVMDDRVFHYGHALEALIKMMGAYNHGQFPINAALTTAAVIGTSVLSAPIAGVAVDAYRGGWITLFTAPLQMRRILGNDASIGAETLLYLDGPWQLGAIVTTWCTGYPNIYSNIQAPPAPDPDYISFVCVPLITVPNGSFFWGQTWGPCWGVADSTVPGSTPNARDIYFATSGNLLAAGVPPGFGAYGMQRAGYLLPRTSFGNGDQFYMLQLQP